jgi:hypothetical protein
VPEKLALKLWMSMERCCLLLLAMQPAKPWEKMMLLFPRSLNVLKQPHASCRSVASPCSENFYHKELQQ